MSINRRQVNLLKTLLEQNGYTPTANIARAIDCSERTVRSDTAAVNAFLAQMGIAARCDSKRGNGIRLAGTATERARIADVIKERALSVDAGLDRFYRGMLLLTCDYRNTYTTESLAHAILTNKQQAQADLRAWNELLTPFGAQIVRGRTISVEGPEEYIRFFVVYYLFELASTAMRRRIEPQVFEVDRSFFSQLIDEVEVATGKPFTDNARHQIAIYLQIMIYRIRKGRSVLGYGTEVAEAYNVLADKIEERFGIQVNVPERLLIRDLFTVSTRRWTPDFQHSYRPSAQAEHLCEALFGALVARYGKRPPLELEKPCAALIEAGLTHRASERAISLPQENTATVRLENMPAYMRLSKTVLDSPDLANLGLYETDNTRIAMLLLSYMDNVSKQDLWSAGLVVNCGIEQVFYARDRIERLVPCLHIARVLTDQEAAASDAGALTGLDFLISFDPVKTSKPLATIGTAVSERDRATIDALIMSLAVRESGANGLNESGLLESLETYRLDITRPRELTRALHALLVEQSLLACPLDRFPRLLETCSFTIGSWLVFTVAAHDVARTAAALIDVDTSIGFIGRKLTRIAVLTVADKDERLLGPITKRFKELAAAAGLSA